MGGTCDTKLVTSLVISALPAHRFNNKDPSRTRQSTPTLAVFLPWGSSDAITSREGSGLSIVIATDRVHLLIRSEPAFTLGLGRICAGGFA